MERTKKMFSSKVFIACLFFFIGYMTNVFLVKINSTTSNKVIAKEDERIPVTPEEFENINSNSLWGNIRNDFESNMDLSLQKKEDDKYVYYEIPMKKNDSGENKLNVEVKDGYIHITADSKDHSMSSSMEQVFNIDSNLDELHANVSNEKDKVVIRIPKKKS